jgi:uncharacterized protein DUF4238
LRVDIIFYRSAISRRSPDPGSAVKPTKSSCSNRAGKSFTSNILNIAVKHDFNRVEIEGHPPDAFEQAMASFEGVLGPALDRILRAGNLRNAEDRGILFNFIGLIAVRNPQHREMWRKFNEKVMNMLMDLATATKDTWENHMSRMRGRLSEEHGKPVVRADAGLRQKKRIPHRTEHGIPHR